MEKALIGAGCFWGIEEYFRNLNGIKNTKVGYSGGHLINPSYEDVCKGTTGHAEVVLTEFNENQLSYNELLNHFWQCHDPTQLNRQGPDIGLQYRSVIFYYNEKQKNIAANSKANLQKSITKLLTTEIAKAKKFFIAEDYHQYFIKKNA